MVLSTGPDHSRGRTRLRQASLNSSPPTLRLGTPIPAEAARAIEQTLQLQHFKWDTQVGDTRVLLPQPLLLPQREWHWLATQAERATREIYGLERAIIADPTLQRIIGVPRALRKLLVPATPATGPRALRFDFHPTATGWALSEVNADVPGGFGEASALPRLFAPFCGRAVAPPDPLTAWGDAVEREIPPGHVALLCAPGHLEDQQVILTLGRELQRCGFTPHVIGSPAALRWRDGTACLVGNEAVPLHFVVRFFQAEWLARLPGRMGWRELCKPQRRTRVSNPLASVISESKRLPLSFAGTTAASDTLRELLPGCRDPRDIDASARGEWVLKAAYANTGDEVHLGAELSAAAWNRLRRRAWLHPSGWIAQRRFETITLPSVCGPMRPCVGIFVVGERAAGAYVRLSHKQVTDAHALEAPLFVLPDEDWP